MADIAVYFWCIDLPNFVWKVINLVAKCAMKISKDQGISKFERYANKGLLGLFALQR